MKHDKQLPAWPRCFTPVAKRSSEYPTKTRSSTVEAQRLPVRSPPERIVFQTSQIPVMLCAIEDDQDAAGSLPD